MQNWWKNLKLKIKVFIFTGALIMDKSQLFFRDSFGKYGLILGIKVYNLKFNSCYFSVCLK